MEETAAGDGCETFLGLHFSGILHFAAMNRENEARGLFYALSSKDGIDGPSGLDSAVFLREYGLSEIQIDRFILWSQCDNDTEITVEEFVRCGNLLLIFSPFGNLQNFKQKLFMEFSEIFCH